MRRILYIITLLIISLKGMGQSEIKTEIKVKPVPGPAAGARAKAGNAGKNNVSPAKQFKDGMLYYNAMPSTPASGTAVKVIDSKDDTDFICKSYKLKTKGISLELASYLQTTVEKENGKVNVSVNLETKDEYIVITAPIFQFPYLEEVIASLDNPGTNFYEDGTKIGSYKLKNRLASEIATFIRTVLLSRNGIVYADDSVNKIYMLDTPSYYDATMSYVKEFDVPPEMVRIEAEIIEIEAGDNFNFGLALEAWKEMLPEEVNMDIDWSKDKVHPGGGPTGWARTVAQSIRINGIRPKAVANFINYLVTTGKAKVLSRPTIVAMNGQEATIESQDTLSYTGYTAADEPLHKQTQVGLELKIRPVIGSDTVALDVEADIRSLIGYSGNGEPIINNRTTTAKVVLEDGELFTLSGLRKDTISKSNSGVPILQSIPFVGYVFRHEVDVKSSKEIVVLLRPRKVTPRSGVMNREKDILDSTNKEVDGPGRGVIGKFFDRVILNKLD